eukprot:scaffold7932_cov112-Isochrysis_galbana.AAC.1
MKPPNPDVDNLEDGALGDCAAADPAATPLMARAASAGEEAERGRTASPLRAKRLAGPGALKIPREAVEAAPRLPPPWMHFSPTRQH